MKVQENITPLDQHVIDFVRELRTSKHLSQTDIANIIHVQRTFIGDVESANQPAKYNLRHINALADYFNISPKDFLPAKPFPVDNSPKEKPKSKIPTQSVLKPLKKSAPKKPSKVAKKKA
jgi:transcriptional regulator with XRE-family HTH domain